MNRNKTYVLTIIYVICLAFTRCIASICSAVEQNCETENTNKYSEEINTKYHKYLELIKQAKESYKPCCGCKCYTQVIANDLEVFRKEGISKKLIENVLKNGVKFQIIENRLYRDENCLFPTRCGGIDHFILKLLPKLPDMEFVVNTRDWPTISKNYGAFGPVFSFSKTSEYHDIMYPAWSFWEGGPAISLYPKGIGRWDIHRKKLGKLANETQWNDKIPKAFFRGSRTSAERDPLVLLSREKPELVDAQYTKNQAWKSVADTLNATPAKEVSFEEHCNYKYLFNFRGVAASFRFKHVLLCKSLVFHVGKEWQEFFYPALKPWIHYIPVESDSTQEKLQELIEFAKHHDNIAKEIAENGYNMIWNNLRMKDVSCYWRELLQRYAKLLNYKPVLDEKLIEITKG